jgi:hypothetical protein
MVDGVNVQGGFLTRMGARDHINDSGRRCLSTSFWMSMQILIDHAR